MSSRFTGPAGPATRLSTATSLAAATAISLGLLWPTSLATSTFAEAKTPGKTYCFYRTCHRVMTLEETRRMVGKRMVLHTSHYDDPGKDRFNPSNLTSSGEWFRSRVPDNAASPKIPNGTVILAWNPATRQSAVLRINNAGPYWGNRTLDVSRAAAERLGFARQGVAMLHVQILQAATREDVTYRKGRRYAAVPGPIGSHASFDLAVAEANRRLGTGQIFAPATIVADSSPAANPVAAPASAPAAEPVDPAPAEVSPIITGGTLPEAVAAAPITPEPARIATAKPVVLAATKPAKPHKAPAAIRTPELRSLTSAEPFSGATPTRRQRSASATTTATVTPAPAPKPRQAAAVRTASRAPVLRNTASLYALEDDGAVARRTRVARAAIRPAVQRNTVAEYAIDDDEIDARRPRLVRTPAPTASQPVRRTPSPLAETYVPAACRGASLSCELMATSEQPERSVRSASAKRP